MASSKDGGELTLMKARSCDKPRLWALIPGRFPESCQGLRAKGDSQSPGAVTLAAAISQGSCHLEPRGYPTSCWEQGHWTQAQSNKSTSECLEFSVHRAMWFLKAWPVRLWHLRTQGCKHLECYPLLFHDFHPNRAKGPSASHWWLCGRWNH
jgi:hypothetical protein